MNFSDRHAATSPAAHPPVCFTIAGLRELLVRGNGTG